MGIVQRNKDEMKNVLFSEITRSMHYSGLLYLRLVLIAHDDDKKSVQFHAQKKS